MFARRFPAHLLPQVEDALAHLLHNVGEGEWEVLLIPVGHSLTIGPDADLQYEHTFNRPRTLYLAVEADEVPTIHPEVDNDGA